MLAERPCRVIIESASGRRAAPLEPGRRRRARPAYALQAADPPCPIPASSTARTTRLLSVAMIAIGVALVVRTLVAGGGGLAIGLLLGVLFVAAGAARLYLQARQGRDS